MTCCLVKILKQLIRYKNIEALLIGATLVNSYLPILTPYISVALSKITIICHQTTEVPEVALQPLPYFFQSIFPKFSKMAPTL